MLPDDLTEIGLALIQRGDVAAAVLKHHVLYTKLVTSFQKIILNECKHLCEKKKFSSILRCTTPKDLLSFSWEKLLNEWKAEAPLLYNILTSVATPASVVSLPEDHKPAVCTAGAILLKSHNLHMSALQHIVGILLFHGNASKQVLFCDSYTKQIMSLTIIYLFYNRLRYA